MSSLWGEEFSVKETVSRTKKVIEKVNKPIVPKTKKALSSKVDITQKLSAISSEVNRILGSYKENTSVIYEYNDFISYIDNAIKNGIIAVDTETDNSLDPLTCKLMGLCLYTSGSKNLYIPVHHKRLKSLNEFEDIPQITEFQIQTQLQRLIDNNVKIIMHNGKFDYQVVKCTCDIELPIYWDTMIGARILNENERAGLKEQYITKIDSSIEKYDIEHLFEKIEYAIVDPEIFSLYAATDAFMTYKLYEYQVKEFNRPGNEKLFNLFMNIEMPIVIVSAEMELTGICLDLDYSKRLSNKYHKLLDECNLKIKAELSKYTDQINNWKLTKEANLKPLKKTGKGFGKSKVEQLEDPINVASPTQLAILLYDILGIEEGIEKKSPRGTGEEILKKISDKYPQYNICKLILENRGLLKLINTYIDKLPECISKKDNRLHAHFNQIGADTGRFSSSDPNLQNIPSHNNEIRMMFTAGYTELDVELVNNSLILASDDEVLSNENWVSAKNLSVGDYIEDLQILTINQIDDKKIEFIFS